MKNESKEVQSMAEAYSSQQTSQSGSCTRPQYLKASRDVVGYE